MTQSPKHEIIYVGNKLGEDTMQHEIIRFHLSTARAYCLMAQSMSSQVYLSKAKEQISKVRELIAEYDNEEITEIYNLIELRVA